MNSNQNYFPQTFVFTPVPASLTARHLRLLCLCEGFSLDARGLERLVEFNGGAVSRSILDLQYWTTTSASNSDSASGKEGKTTLHDGDDGGNKIRPRKHSESEGAAAEKMGEKGSSTSNSERNTGDDVEGKGKRKKKEEEISKGDRGDSIAKLMALSERGGGGVIEERNPPEEGDTRCFFYGDAFSALGSDGHLFGDLRQAESLWAGGFAELYEMNRDAVIPFPRGAAQPVAKKVYPLSDSEGRGGGGCRIKNGAFLADSASDADDEVESDQKKSGEGGATPLQDGNADNGPGTKAGAAEPAIKANNFPRTESEKAAFSRARAAVLQLGECAEISSRFLRSADPPPWWTKQPPAAAPSELGYDSLGLEMGATAQFMAASAARKVVADLTKGVPEADLGNLCLASADDGEKEFVVANKMRAAAEADDRRRDAVCSEVLNKVLPEMTASPQAHVLDLMPVLRGMARTEEMRRVGRGEGKRSRSGRFLHYFEAHDIYLQPATVIEMCNTFL